MIEEGCRVGFFGLGCSSSALLGCLPLDNCSVTLRSDQAIDQENVPSGVRVERIFDGKDACKNIDEDVVIFSPSVRRDRAEFLEAEARGVIFTSDAELFFESNDTPIFLITGSDGKSTTATLTHLLLTKAGYNAPLIGNIGEPFMKHYGRKTDFYVCEMSSFMLQYMTPKAKAACITNITPNHLDWHKSLDEYRETKLSVRNKTDRLIIADDLVDVKDAYGIISVDKSLEEIKNLYKANLYITICDGKIFKNGKPLIEIAKIPRNEKHNLKNLMMAIALTDGLVSDDDMLAVAKSFQGLKHRCECVLRENGIDYIDSSIDSTPARTKETLKSLDRSVVIILGGRGKGLDYSELAPEVRRYVRKAIITGENAKEIYGAISNVTNCEIIEDFERAVLQGKRYAEEVGTLLLSPASTSFDKFRNYAERGDRFKEILLKSYQFDNNSLQNIEETRKRSETDLS